MTETMHTPPEVAIVAIGYLLREQFDNFVGQRVQLDQVLDPKQRLKELAVDTLDSVTAFDALVRRSPDVASIVFNASRLVTSVTLAGAQTGALLAQRRQSRRFIKFVENISRHPEDQPVHRCQGEACYCLELSALEII